jgi:hypothetical protein
MGVGLFWVILGASSRAKDVQAGAFSVRNVAVRAGAVISLWFLVKKVLLLIDGLGLYDYFYPSRKE